MKTIMNFLIYPLKKIKLFSIIIAVQLKNLITPRKQETETNIPELQEILVRSRNRTDFNDHMETIFLEGLFQKPKMIMELGTRGGESTFVFSRIAKLTRSHFVSVDLEDCSDSSDYPDWIFVKNDDVDFASKFSTWCAAKNINPEIDLLFIDTSHLYEHTKEEIKHWFPHLAKECTVIFHDSNLRYVFKRRDGSMGISGWDNKRGVIRALEDYLECQYDEEKPFVDIRRGWLVRHWPECSGLTILKR